MLIAALAALVLIHFALLIGGSPGTAVPLVLSVPLVLLIGVAVESLRRRPADDEPAVVPTRTAGLEPTTPTV